MVDETSQQVIRVTFQTARPMVSSIAAALMKAAQSMKQQQQTEPSAEQRPRGEQTPQELNAQNREVKLLNIPEGNLDALRTELNKYGVDFAVMPNGEQGAQVLYKFQDVSQVEAAVQSVLQTSVAGLSKGAKDVVQAATKLPLADRLAAASKVAAERNTAAAATKEQVQKHAKDVITH